MFLLYNLLLTLLSPIWVPWMLIRTARRRERPNWGERMGNFNLPKTTKRRIWFHAVSVGEVVAAMPILRELRKELPAHEIVLSVTTSSGHQTAREKATGLYDHLVYFPIDVARFQLVAMQRVRPDVVVIMETELWMNFLWAAKVFDARTVLVNGRISDRSFPRSMKLRFFYRHLLSQMDRCLMQSETDAERIRALGAKSAEVFGNCKFDQALEGLDADPSYWRTELGLLPDRPTIVVGSARTEEGKFLAMALSDVHFEPIQVVYAPRHIERAKALEEGLQEMKSEPQIGYRSQGDKMPASGLLVLDTYGELAKVYSVADVVVVGGGFADLGGQNILQPLAHGKPVLHGRHMQNFRDVTAMADASGAAIQCIAPHDLAKTLDKLLNDANLRHQLGEAASRLVRENTGASRRYAAAVGEETLQVPRGK